MTILCENNQQWQITFESEFIPCEFVEVILIMMLISVSISEIFSLLDICKPPVHKYEDK